MITSHSDIAVKNVPSTRGLNFIEQLHAVSQLFCNKVNRVFVTGISESERIAVLMRPPCKMWDCEACAARNGKRWIARILNHINRNDVVHGWRFFTLTAHENWRGETASVKNLRQGWKKLYNRIRREFGVNDYVKIWERHKDGTFHLHGLMDAPITKKWLKKAARQCGMGYQVDIRRVDNAGKVAGYIAKYMLKSEGGIGHKYPKGLRRVEVSRNWTRLPDLKADTVMNWILNQTREGQIQTASIYYRRGFDIIDSVKTENIDRE